MYLQSLNITNLTVIHPREATAKSWVCLNRDSPWLLRNNVKYIRNFFFLNISGYVRTNICLTV